ncbi:fetal and adult testis-expressed transcript protein homolog [Nannospalax galili]|uniref:fetal and adult testis-expressed transcript protein homolog n=1 Tax=Nannospalax galili TaxID=1026970 RepID=UPI0004ED0F80|nr:fetal and adult testis-expressed transcript protein homolog [Nannospalax galili]
MAGRSSDVKEEIEMTILDDLGTGSLKQSQEQLLMQEMMEPEPHQLGGARRHSRMETKPAGFGPLWNVTGPWPKKEMQVITVRLRALEEQSTAWHHHKEAALFAVLLLVFVASLWLWIHQ